MRCANFIHLHNRNNNQIHKGMATIKAIVRTTKKSGTANVRFRVSDGRGVQLWHVSEIEVDVNLWDNAKERINTLKVCAPRYRKEIDGRVNDRKQLVADVYEENKDSITCSSDLEKIIDGILNPYVKTIEEMNFFEIFELFLAKRDLSASEFKNYKSLERSLYRYECWVKRSSKKFQIVLSEVGKDMIEDFMDYCRNEYELISEYPNFFAPILESYPLLGQIKRKTSQVEKRGSNTLIKYQQRLKAFFNWCVEEGIIEKTPFVGVRVSSAKYGTPFYITIAERDAIYHTDLSHNRALERQRDIFVFQCLIGCRVGDLINLKRSNVVGDSLQYIPHKTMKEKPQTLVVPLHPIAKEILAKYKTDGDNSPLLPFIAAQKYNEAIKEIFTACGITRMVTILNPKTGEPQQVHINEVASSHLARRTFVGNLYKQVKDPNLIGKLSGHSEGSRAFARYRDIDEEMKKELINLL